MEEIMDFTKHRKIMLLLEPELAEELDNISKYFFEKYGGCRISKDKIIKIAISHFIENYSSIMELVNYGEFFKTKKEEIEKLEAKK